VFEFRVVVVEVENVGSGDWEECDIRGVKMVATADVTEAIRLAV
jgi:hypothetical protein